MNTVTHFWNLFCYSSEAIRFVNSYYRLFYQYSFCEDSWKTILDFEWNVSNCIHYARQSLLENANLVYNVLSVCLCMHDHTWSYTYKCARVWMCSITRLIICAHQFSTCTLHSNALNMPICICLHLFNAYIWWRWFFIRFSPPLSHNLFHKITEKNRHSVCVTCVRGRACPTAKWYQHKEVLLANFM